MQIDLFVNTVLIFVVQHNKRCKGAEVCKICRSPHSELVHTSIFYPLIFQHFNFKSNADLAFAFATLLPLSNIVAFVCNVYYHICAGPAWYSSV
jgi:hypothetical protein